MKKSKNFNPLNDQAEGYLKLIHHKIKNIIVGKKCVISDGVNTYPALCIRKEEDCAYMVTEDGRNFRVTEYSIVQAYYAYFKNETDKAREGFKLGNFWLYLHGENIVRSLFENGKKEVYILWDNTDKDLALYYTRDQRQDMRIQALFGGTDMRLSFHFC